MIDWAAIISTPNRGADTGTTKTKENILSILIKAIQTYHFSECAILKASSVYNVVATEKKRLDPVTHL